MLWGILSAYQSVGFHTLTAWRVSLCWSLPECLELYPPISMHSLSSLREYWAWTIHLCLSHLWVIINPVTILLWLSHITASIQKHNWFTKMDLIAYDLYKVSIGFYNFLLILYMNHHIIWNRGYYLFLSNLTANGILSISHWEDVWYEVLTAVEWASWASLI